MTLEEAKKLIKIDKYLLDDECEKHTTYFLEIAQGYADAISRRDELKEDRDYIFSKQFLIAKGGEKISDLVATSKAESSDEYINATRLYLQSRKEAEEWSSMKESWQQRASMLKYLSELYISGYFGINVKSPDIGYETIKHRLEKGRENA